MIIPPSLDTLVTIANEESSKMIVPPPETSNSIEGIGNEGRRHNVRNQAPKCKKTEWSAEMKNNPHATLYDMGSFVVYRVSNDQRKERNFCR